MGILAHAPTTAGIDRTAGLASTARRRAKTRWQGLARAQRCATSAARQPGRGCRRWVLSRPSGRRRRARDSCYAALRRVASARSRTPGSHAGVRAAEGCGRATGNPRCVRIFSTTARSSLVAEAATASILSLPEHRLVVLGAAEHLTKRLREMWRGYLASTRFLTSRVSPASGPNCTSTPRTFLTALEAFGPDTTILQ